MVLKSPLVKTACAIFVNSVNGLCALKCLHQNKIGGGGGSCKPLLLFLWKGWHTKFVCHCKDQTQTALHIHVKWFISQLFECRTGDVWGKHVQTCKERSEERRLVSTLTCVPKWDFKMLRSPHILPGCQDLKISHCGPNSYVLPGTLWWYIGHICTHDAVGWQNTTLLAHGSA